MQNTIRKIVEKINIVSVIRKHVSLHREGLYLVGRCPFHEDDLEVFYVDPILRSFCCYGCGKTGNVIDFVMKYNGVSFKDAVNSLCQMIDIPVPNELYDIPNKKPKEKVNQKRLYKINELAADFFKENLKEKAIKYCRERKLSDEIIEKFSLGYAPLRDNSLYSFLTEKGYKKEEIEASGLIGEKETENKTVFVYDKFWDRLMFPIRDIDGKIIGFGGRTLEKDGLPKYINSKDTPVFKKGENLYGLNFAKNAEFIILCEGNVDVISLHQAGFSGAVASLGTALTIAQAKLLKSLNKEIYISYDTDPAGINATLKAIKLLNEQGVRPRILSFDGAKDPDEFIKNFGANAFKVRIRKAVPDYVFVGHYAKFEDAAEMLLKEM